MSRKVGEVVIDKISLTKITGEVLLDDMLPLVREIVINQSIEVPSVRVVVTVQDNIGLYTALVGQEVLYLDMESFGKRIQWQCNLNELGDLIDGEKYKMYNLTFISREAYLNNNTRHLFSYKNAKISSIVNKLLKTDLGTQKKVEIEKTEHKGSFICPNLRPFEFIDQLAAKSVRSKRPDQAGFMFFESLKGWHFKSMDGLCEQEPKYTYTYQPKNIGNEARPGSPDLVTDMFSVSSLVMEENLNITEHLRKGAYGGIYYGVDFVNLKSENNIAKPYSIRENYKRMSTLGSKSPFDSFVDAEGSNVGGNARIMYSCISPHLFGDSITREAKDQSGPIGGITGDRLRQAQNISGGDFDTSYDTKPYMLSRYYALNHLKGRIQVPGNLDIHAGDVINLTVPQWNGDETVQDLNNSGRYLVTGVSHMFKHPNGLKSFLYITRDSYR